MRLPSCHARYGLRLECRTTALSSAPSPHTPCAATHTVPSAFQAAPDLSPGPASRPQACDAHHLPVSGSLSETSLLLLALHGINCPSPSPPKESDTHLGMGCGLFAQNSPAPAGRLSVPPLGPCSSPRSRSSPTCPSKPSSGRVKGAQRGLFGVLRMGLPQSVACCRPYLADVCLAPTRWMPQLLARDFHLAQSRSSAGTRMENLASLGRGLRRSIKEWREWRLGAHPFPSKPEPACPIQRLPCSSAPSWLS